MVMSWPYIAGFFDGEGNVRLSGSLSSVQLSLHQSGKRGKKVLETIRDFLLNEHGISSRVAEREERTKNQPMFRLYIYNRVGVVMFIHGVMPYLHVKKVECQDLLRYLTIVDGISASMCRADFMRRRETCGNGHPLKGNVYTRRRGRHVERACKTCSKDRANSRYAARTKIAAEVQKWL